MIHITAILSTLLAIADSICIDTPALTENNVYLEDSLFGETPASSILECAAECSTHSDCLSFGFEPETRSCHLHTQNSTTGSRKLSGRMNWLHGDISKWSKITVYWDSKHIALGPCSSDKCASSQKCILHRITKVPLCVKAEVMILPKHCPEPAAIPNANISSGHQREGSVRTYTCYHGYLNMSHDSVTATTTCLINGSWSPVIFKCSGPYIRVEMQSTDRIIYIRLSKKKLDVITGNTSSVMFWIKNCRAANFALHTNPDNKVGKEYKVSIGGWGNTKSAITMKRKMLSVHFEPGVVSCTDFRPFWLSWRDGFISVGKGNNIADQTFMKWKSQNVLNVGSVGISSCKSAGTWLFYRMT